jgi:chemotaxis signal transduction protein
MAENNAPGTSAWILQFGPNDRAAVGQRELLHIVHAVPTFPVPLTPAHCREVIYWQDRPVPLMDLSVWLGAGTGKNARQYVGIVGYQLRLGEPPHFGALWLAAPPVRTTVADSQACVLPETSSAWSEIAISCFKDGAESVPVLDLPRLFSLPMDMGRPTSTQQEGITSQLWSV